MNNEWIVATVNVVPDRIDKIHIEMKGIEMKQKNNRELLDNIDWPFGWLADYIYFLFLFYLLNSMANDGIYTVNDSIDCGWCDGRVLRIC